MSEEMNAPIDSFKRNATEEVRATLRTFRGKKYVDVRIYYLDEGEFKPTKKGINISVDHLGALTRMMEKLAEAIRAEAVAAPAQADVTPPPDSQRNGS
jgi:hypothetical protein